MAPEVQYMFNLALDSGPFVYKTLSGNVTSLLQGGDQNCHKKLSSRVSTTSIFKSFSKNNYFIPNKAFRQVPCSFHFPI